LKLGAKVELIIEIDISTIKAEIRTEKDVGIRATRAKFKVRFKIKVTISIRAEIGKASIEVVVEVSVRAKIRKESIEVVIEVSIRVISVFSTDRVTEARGTKGSYNTKSRTEFKVRTGIIETKVSVKAKTGIRIVKAYIKSVIFRFVRIVSYRTIVLKVRKGSRLKVC